MGRRGPKPKPTALKVLAGTRRDRVNDAEPTPPPGLPEAPAHLDDVARVEWDRMAALLAEMGTLSSVDGSALALYCSYYARWVKAEHKLQTEGYTTTTAAGADKASPYVAISSAAMRGMERLLAEFGCTPSSRGRTAVERPQARSALELFLEKRSAT